MPSHDIVFELLDWMRCQGPVFLLEQIIMDFCHLIAHDSSKRQRQYRGYFEAPQPISHSALNAGEEIVISVRRVIMASFFRPLTLMLWLYSRSLWQAFAEGWKNTPTEEGSEGEEKVDQPFLYGRGGEWKRHAILRSSSRGFA